MTNYKICIIVPELLVTLSGAFNGKKLQIFTTFYFIYLKYYIYVIHTTMKLLSSSMNTVTHFFVLKLCL
jgi:hypothetical protein